MSENEIGKKTEASDRDEIDVEKKKGQRGWEKARESIIWVIRINKLFLFSLSVRAAHKEKIVRIAFYSQFIYEQHTHNMILEFIVYTELDHKFQDIL